MGRLARARSLELREGEARRVVVKQFDQFDHSGFHLAIGERCKLVGDGVLQPLVTADGDSCIYRAVVRLAGIGFTGAPVITHEGRSGRLVSESMASNEGW